MDLVKELRRKIKACAKAEAMPYDGEDGKAMKARMRAGIALDDFVMVNGDELVGELTELLDAPR